MYRLVMIVLISSIGFLSSKNFEFINVNEFKSDLGNIYSSAYSKSNHSIFFTRINSKKIYKYSLFDSTISILDVDSLVLPLYNRKSFTLMEPYRKDDQSKASHFCINPNSKDVFLAISYLELIEFSTILNKEKNQLDTSLGFGHALVFKNLTNENKSIIPKYNLKSILYGFPILVDDEFLIGSSDNDNYLYKLNINTNQVTSLLSTQKIENNLNLKYNNKMISKLKYISDSTVLCYSIGSLKPIVFNVLSGKLKMIEDELIDSCFGSNTIKNNRLVFLEGVEIFEDKLYFIIVTKDLTLQKLLNIDIIITDKNLNKINKIEKSLNTGNYQNLKLIEGIDSKYLYFIKDNQDYKQILKLDLANLSN
ncbi:MAG: hypothetical protein NTW25_04320 [Candidatus Kapabacteria bacterium]|nr:hypothetical protein [Candidatus Kapabacteria bacterium]